MKNSAIAAGQYEAATAEPPSAALDMCGRGLDGGVLERLVHAQLLVEAQMRTRVAMMLMMAMHHLRIGIEHARAHLHVMRSRGGVVRGSAAVEAGSHRRSRKHR